MTLLIHPPAAKACEPPAGIARLAGALRAHGRPVSLWDANLEAQLALLGQEPAAADRWTREARARRDLDLDLLRTPAGYRDFGRYTASLRRLNRLLAANGAGGDSDALLSLSDYQHRRWSPLRSEDLLAAAESPQLSPFHPWLRAALAQQMAALNPSLVGISLNYLSQALPAFALIGLLRRDYPGVPIALGGGLLTSWMRRPGWRSPFAGLVDYLVAGPGEAALLHLAAGQQVTTPPQPGESAAPACRPDYAGIAWEEYLAPGPILPYDTARGCYWNRCAFCPEPAEGDHYRPLPAATVLADLQHLINLHRPALIHFTDNALSPALLRHLIAAPPGVPWYGFVRITPQLEDPDFCRGLRQSGCLMLKIGLESGDDRVLEGMQKGVSAAQSARALKAMAAAGLPAYVYLLFGTPWEDAAAAERTAALVREEAAAITYINAAIFNLPVDGESAARLEQRRFYRGDLQLYSDFSHPLGWGRREVRHFLDRTFRRDPVIAAILRRTPPWFTSNHAPFFAARFAGASPPQELASSRR